MHLRHKQFTAPSVRPQLTQLFELIRQENVMADMGGRRAGEVHAREIDHFRDMACASLRRA